MQQANDRTDNTIAVILALLVYIPSTSVGNYIRLGVVIVAFVMKHMNERPEKSIGKIALFMVLSPLISVFFVIMFEGFSINWALVTHEIQRMLFCALMLMTVVKMNISFRLIYIITILALMPNFLIQLLQYAKVQSVFNFIESNYQTGVEAEEWTHLDLAREEGSSFRSGSIFLNPNVYMAIPLMALVIFLHQDKEKSSIWNYALIACATISCFLTGSRTATIVLAVMMVWYIVKYAATLSRILLVFAIALVLYRYGAYLVTTRGAQIFDTASFELKINSFDWFWKSTVETPIYWITGAIGSKEANMVFDGEIGHLYGWYGLFGLYWYVKYYRFALKNNSEKLFYTKPLTAVHAFVAITASVLLCMPIYPFAALLIFAKQSESNKVIDGESE